jgi:hypothetical protein
MDLLTEWRGCVEHFTNCAGFEKKMTNFRLMMHSGVIEDVTSRGHPTSVSITVAASPQAPRLPSNEQVDIRQMAEGIVTSLDRLGAGDGCALKRA